MGEGFGDFFAGMITLDKGDAAYQAARRYCIAEWDATTYNPVVGNDDGSGCLRWIDGTDEGTARTSASTRTRRARSTTTAATGRPE